ncbi:hypothetical protein [Steroidobacter cummioxidans]|nr:hypothetical protein [Steroidobacter cummioxidans]
MYLMYFMLPNVYKTLSLKFSGALALIWRAQLDDFPAHQLTLKQLV